MTTTGVTREAAQAFVESLKNFNDTLPPEQQAMLRTILGAAQGDETAGYGRRYPRNESGQAAEDETAGYRGRYPRGEDDGAAEEDETAGYGYRRIPRSESDAVEQRDETAGYGVRRPRSDTSSQDDGRWEGLVAWLSASDEDETEGFGRNRP